MEKSNKPTFKHWHNHYRMGAAPYRLLGVWSMPTVAMSETNPAAYEAEMKSRPTFCNGSCDHCGTGITHHYMVMDADGKRFAVGSSCIEKLGDCDLVSAASKHRREQLAKARQEERIKRFESCKAAREATLDEERLLNGGLTNAELESEIRRENEKLRLNQRREVIAVFEEDLAKSGDFGKSIVASFLKGSIPSGYALKICAEILAKKHGRKSSKAYLAAFPEKQELIESAVKQLANLNAEWND